MIYGATVNVGDAVVGSVAGPDRHLQAGQSERRRADRWRQRRRRRAVRAERAARCRRADRRSSTRRIPTTTISSCSGPTRRSSPTRSRTRRRSRTKSAASASTPTILSPDFGSGGRLRSLVVMDWLGKYPDNPTQKFLGENNTVSVMGQECGHRWLAFLEFRDRTGQTVGCAPRPRSRALELLLRFRRLGHGRQRHRGSRRRILQDRCRGAALQPARSVRDGARSRTRPCRRSSTSRTRRTCRRPARANRRRRSASRSMEPAATSSSRTSSPFSAPRSPSSADSARVHRQAFVYVVSAGKTADVRARSRRSMASAARGKGSSCRPPTSACRRSRRFAETAACRTRPYLLPFAFYPLPSIIAA